MAVFVLVHGAYIGGWAWERLVPVLEDYGHTAHAPTSSVPVDVLPSSGGTSPQPITPTS